jgi:hypothetical protein
MITIDPPAPRSLAGGEIGAEDIDLEDAPHALGAHLRKLRRRRDNAGIGDDRGERPQRLGRRAEHADHIGFDGDIAL